MIDHMIHREAMVVATEGVAFAVLDGEAILLDINSGQYYGLNEVGTRIMDLLREPVVVDVILEKLFQEYDVETGELEHDVMSFLQTLEERKLIQMTYGTAA